MRAPLDRGQGGVNEAVATGGQPPSSDSMRPAWTEAVLPAAGSPTKQTQARASGSEGYDHPQALVSTRCMRQHGIDLPDPQITAEGIDQPPAPGVRRDDPRATAAEQACAQRGTGGK